MDGGHRPRGRNEARARGASRRVGGWNVELLLDSIIEAAHQGRCNALIDTGALITGLTNQEVGEPSQDATYSRSAREGCRVGFGEEGFNMEKHHETR